MWLGEHGAQQIQHKRRTVGQNSSIANGTVFSSGVGRLIRVSSLAAIVIIDDLHSHVCPFRHETLPNDMVQQKQNMRMSLWFKNALGKHSPRYPVSSIIAARRSRQSYILTVCTRRSRFWLQWHKHLQERVASSPRKRREETILINISWWDL